MTEEIKTCDNNQKMSVYCNTCVCKSCEQLKRLEQEKFALTQESQQKSQTICELEQENKELKAYKDVNEDFKKAWDELNKKYTEVLKLAKLNADSNEYCLKKLEKENKNLKKQIESQKGLITVGGKQQYEMTMAYDKCKTALEEIRVIADDTFKVCDDDCGNARKIKLIIDKINEVLE